MPPSEPSRFKNYQGGEGGHFRQSAPHRSRLVRLRCAKPEESRGTLAITLPHLVAYALRSVKTTRCTTAYQLGDAVEWAAAAGAGSVASRVKVEIFRAALGGHDHTAGRQAGGGQLGITIGRSRCKTSRRIGTTGRGCSSGRSGIADRGCSSGRSDTADKGRASGRSDTADKGCSSGRNDTADKGRASGRIGAPRLVIDFPVARRNKCN